MQINGAYLMPQMNSTGTGATGAQMLNEEASFQAQLQAAKDKLEQTSEVKTLQRDWSLYDKIISDNSRSESIRWAKISKVLTGSPVIWKNKLFGDDNAMEIYRDMYNEELTKVAAEGGGIGLADFIYKQLAQTK